MTQVTRTPKPSSFHPALDLPAEVLGNVIEQLQPEPNDREMNAKSEDLRALSLVSRAWVREAQRILFRTIFLHPAKYRLDNREVQGPDTLSKFSDLMATSPHLGEYIKELDITLPRLGLHNITYPSGILDKCTRIQSLDLRDTRFYVDHLEEAAPDCLCPKLNNLTIDRDTLPYLKHSKGEKRLSVLSKLSTLSISILTSDGLPEDSPQQLILSQPTALLSLVLLPAFSINPAEDDEHSIYKASPLAHLNAMSFASLVYLRSVPSFLLDDDNALVRDPYQGLLVGGAIAMLSQLRELHVKVLLERENWEGYSWDSILGEQCQWYQLDRVLATSHHKRTQLALVHLTCLQLTLVFTRGTAGDGLVWDVVNKVTEQVYERQFPSLADLEQDGKIEFIYESIVLTG